MAIEPDGLSKKGSCGIKILCLLKKEVIGSYKH